MGNFLSSFQRLVYQSSCPLWPPCFNGYSSVFSAKTCFLLGISAMEKTLSLQLQEHNFKLRVSTILNSWKLHRARLSLLLNLKHLRLEVTIDTAPSSKETLKSKLFRFLKKLRPKCLQNNTSLTGKKHSCFKDSSTRTQKNLINLGSTLCEEPIISPVLVNLAYLSRSLSEKNKSGIIIHSSTLLVSLAILFINFLSRVSYFSLILIPVLASFIGFSLNYLNCLGNISKDICMARKYLTSFVFLHLQEVMLSRCSKYIWGKTTTRLRGFFLSGLICSVSLVATHFGHSKSSKLTLF